MKEIGDLEMDNVKQKVFLIGDAADYVDLGFIPNGCVFYDSLEADSTTNEGQSIVIVDLNSQRTLSNVDKFLDQGANRVQVVWNAAKGKEFSYSMLALARKSFSFDFQLHGSTARLTVWRVGQGPSNSSLPIDSLRELLIEQLRTPSPLSMEEGERLIESQARLLTELESQIQQNLYLALKLEELERQAREIPQLVETVRELNSETEMLRQKNRELSEGANSLFEPHENGSKPSATIQNKAESSDELDVLKKKYSDLEKVHKRLNTRYEALANSKLGALTLKRWERKSKSVGK